MRLGDLKVTIMANAKPLLDAQIEMERRLAELRYKIDLPKPEPCPFCGCEEVSMRQVSPGVGKMEYTQLECNRCTANVRGDGALGALNRWNKRSPAERETVTQVVEKIKVVEKIVYVREKPIDISAPIPRVELR